MRVIFLDIDGVLNSEKDPPDSPAILPDKIKLLNQLGGNGVVFVLSSSWRSQWGFYELRKIFREAGFKGRLVDYTTMMWEDLEGNVLHRGGQIKLWIKMHRDSIEGYVILDDCNLKCPEVEDNWVKTQARTGVTQKDIDRAKEILWSNNDEEGI